MQFSKILFILIFAQKTTAQINDSLKTIHLENVMVSAYKDKSFQKSSLHISPIFIDSFSNSGNFNLTELLAKTPGVSMLSTGIGIVKPVIRGLYGNRILVLLAGLKFDNQQWQEEHGLGLSTIGLSKVELIKGPLSVLYGTEAMGGIINLIEEQKAPLHQQESDFSIKLNSNTLGGLAQAGYKKNTGKYWFRIRVGAENQGDYSDGKNNRVLNSRMDGYYLKSSVGFQHKNWISENNFSSSFNRFGFIFNDLSSFILPDKRWSRNLGINPAHFVLLNIISSENKFSLKDSSKLNLNIGFQSNKRMENEGSGAISLNMHLVTFQYLLKWEKRISAVHKMVISNLGSMENNTNYGARKIVPDANMQESNLSIYVESEVNSKINFENGVGFGEKFIQTLLTPSVNSAKKEIKPFTKFSPYYNAYTGFSYISSAHFNLKINVATGVRIPNLAELSSNGLHEGVFTYEIGSPKLKNEQNFSVNLFANYTSQFIQFSVSPFYNYFLNYVYLAPTTENWFGFPVYRFRQQNAQQYGSEFSFTLKPLTNLQFSVSYSGMLSKTQDGNYTPYIPASKISPAFQYNPTIKNKINLSFSTQGEYYLAQNHLYKNELATPSYFLWNAGISSKWETNKKTFELGIFGNNLLNKAYYDHLSRLKNYGLLNIGRNIGITFKLKFSSALKAK